MLKKKIKDLTKEEMKDICKHIICSECPLNLQGSRDCIRTLESKYNIKEVLEKEIEVEENVKEN